MGAMRGNAPDFDLNQIGEIFSRHFSSMAVFIYRCPNTGLKVQGWVADNPKPHTDTTYEAVACVACTRLHMVNPSTGRVLGGADD